MVSNGTPPSIHRLIDDVKSLGFLWIKNRAKINSLDWEKWFCFNVI